ncbi:MAG: hypothetical protein ABI641_07530 [Caldimonas sp.]
MKKDVIATPLLPFSDDEETALIERLAAMDSAALTHYTESARLSLANKGLDASWRPRIEIGLQRAEVALAKQLLAEAAAAAAAEVAPVAVAKAPKTAKAKSAKSAKAKSVEAETETDDDEGDEVEPAEAKSVEA